MKNSKRDKWKAKKEKCEIQKKMWKKFIEWNQIENKLKKYVQSEL